MIQFIVLVLVALIVSQNVEVLKKLKDFFLNKEWKTGKLGLPISIAVAAWAAVTLNIGITSALLAATQIAFTLPAAFYYFDIFSSALLLSQGAASLIGLFEKFKELRKIK